MTVKALHVVPATHAGVTCISATTAGASSSDIMVVSFICGRGGRGGGAGMLGDVCEH